MEIQLLGNSMSPLIKNKDNIKIKLFSQPKEIHKEQIGKILFFHDQHEWISHRLILHKNELFLKGDFSNSLQSIKKQKAWGEVVEIKSGEKKINPNSFSKQICFFTKLHLTSSNKILKKIFKVLIYTLNSVNRYLSN